jgi:hypothetical protein
VTPRAGDFGLVRINGYAGRLIRLGQALNGDGFSEFEHAVLHVGSDELIEAEPGGARIRPVSEYDGTNIVWSDWSLTGAARMSITTHGRTLAGVPYSALDYFALAAHRLHIPAPGLRDRVANSHHLICSQLVDEAYFAAGLTIFDDGRWSGYVTPGSLVRALHGPVTA